MNSQRFVFFFGMVVLAWLLVPVVYAADPLWKVPATTSGELSGVVISADGSTVVAGGDQLIALSRDGRKLWTGWSGSRLAISRDGNYIVTSRDQTVRMISGSGSMLWDTSLETPVKDLSMTPAGDLIAAAAGSRVRLINGTGTGFRQNNSITANHLRLFPDGNMLVVTTAGGILTPNQTLFSDWSDLNVTQDFVEVAADGSSFVTVTNNRVRFYTRGGTQLWERAIPGGNTLSFAYSRDGSTIVLGRDDNTVEVLDGNGTRLWTGHAPYWVTSVAVSENGNTIAAGSLDKTLSVYDHAGTKLGSATTANPIKSGSVAVSSDGTLIAAVDSSAVYGFSRDQFTQPAPTTPAPPAATAGTAAPAGTTLLPATSVPAAPSQQPVTSAPVTQKAALPPAVPLTAAGLLFLLCRQEH